MSVRIEGPSGATLGVSYHSRAASPEGLCRSLADIEVDYEPRKEPAVVFLRRFIDCSDVMPGSTCDEVAGKVNFRRPDARGMT